MKRWTIWMVVGCCGLLGMTATLDGCFKQDDSAGAVAGPCIRVSERTVDVGKTSSAVPFEWQISFENVGTEELKIEDLAADCSCTEIEAEPILLVPGQKGCIRGRIDPRRSLGPKTYKAFIKSNSSREPMIAVVIRAFVVQDIVVSPREVYLGRVRDEWNGKVWVVVREPGVRVTKVSSSAGSGVEATIASERRTYDGRLEFRINVKVNSRELEPGQIDSSVIIHTNSASCPEIQVPIVGIAIGELDPDPSVVFCGILEPLEEFKTELALSARKGGRLVYEVEQPRVGRIEVQHLIKQPGGREHVMLVRVAAGQQEGAIRGNIVAWVDGNDRSRVSIPVSGYVNRSAMGDADGGSDGRSR